MKSPTSPFTSTFVNDARGFNNHFHVVAVILKQSKRGLLSEVPINPTLGPTEMRQVRRAITLAANGGTYVNALAGMKKLHLF